MVKSGAAVKPDANDSYGTMMTLFKEGKVGMIINGPWEVANIAGDPNFGGFENLGVAPVPAGSAGAGAPVGGHNYVIYSGMDESKADAAIAFVKFMSSAESEAFIADELGLLPGNADAYDLSSRTTRRSPPGSRRSTWRQARPWIPEGGQFFAPLDEMATKVLVQGADPQKALDEVAKTYKSDVVTDYSLSDPRRRRGAGLRPGPPAPAARRQHAPRLEDRPRSATHWPAPRPDGAAGRRQPAAARSFDSTGTPGRWCCRPSLVLGVLVLYPLVQGIYQSFTDLNEANQQDEICTKTLGGGEDVQAQPRTGRVRRAARTTSTC